MGHLQGEPAAAGPHEDQGPPHEAGQAVLEAAHQLHRGHGLPPDGAHAEQRPGGLRAEQEQGQLPCAMLLPAPACVQVLRSSTSALAADEHGHLHPLTALPAGLLTATRAVSPPQCLHLFRDTSPVLLATGGASLSLIELHCRWACRSSAAGVSLRLLCLAQQCCMCPVSRQQAPVLGAAACSRLTLPPAAPPHRWKSSVLTAHYLEKAGTIVGVRAVALLAGLPEDFKQQCYIGRVQVPVPEAWVDKLLPGIFTLQRELRNQVQQASSKRDVDYSSLALADTLIMLAQAVLQCMPFRISAYGSSYALLQLPAVRQIVLSPQWPQFSSSILSSHSHMEQLRQAPWQKMIPGLAGTLSQLQGDVQSLTAAVQQQTAVQAQQAAGQVQQLGQAAAQPQAQQGAAASSGVGCKSATAQPVRCSSRQQVPLPDERPQVAARLLCSRVQTVEEAYKVRRALCGGCCGQLLKSRQLLQVLCSSSRAAYTTPAASPLQEWYVGRWPSQPVAQAIESIRKQPKLVLGHVNSQAISKCRALPELVSATVPLAGSVAEAIRRVELVQRELKLTLSEMREACRALKAAADSSLGIPAGKLVPSTERKKRVPLAAVRAALLRACVAVW